MSGRRTTLVVVGLVLAFVAPMSTAYALWSRTASATLAVSVQAAGPSVVSYYLHNAEPDTGNTASSNLPLKLLPAAPTATSLPNYDTNRDSSAGLLLSKGSGLGETDLTKHQLWSIPGPINANAPVRLRLWSAMKGFDTSKRGSVVAGLYRCNNNDSFASCSLLDQETVAPPGSWSGGSTTWVQKEWNFGPVNLDVPSNRRLYVKLVVNSSSDDDMWFAYDTEAQPSALRIG